MPNYEAFSIFITTKDRASELRYTLESLDNYIKRGVKLLICDDGSTDETDTFLRTNYPSIVKIRNSKSKGLIYCRNQLLNQVKTPYAVSLDDDLNFLTEDPFAAIQNYFERERNCAVVSFRIFWSKSKPSTTASKDEPHRVRNYAGGAHAMRMAAWQGIPDYPDWFVFYGEEEFASCHFLRRGWEIHYLPEVLTQHRVNNNERKKNKDYVTRLRRSLRSGWFLYYIFLPWIFIPKKFAFSIWMQLKNRLATGNLHSYKAFFLALGDLVLNFPKLLLNRTPLTFDQYHEYQRLPSVKLYWNPSDEHKSS